MPLMAILLPSLPDIRKLKVPPTDGELYLCEFLEEKLGDDFYVFFNPYLDCDRPDIIVLKQGCGAVIVEIKDWSLDSYTIDQKNRWSVNNSIIKSPFLQVFQYKSNLFNLHLPILGLKEALNKRFFSVIACYVYFHLGTKRNIKEKYKLPLDKIELEIKDNNKRFKIKHAKENNELLKKKLYNDYKNKMNYLERKRKQLNRDQRLATTKDTADVLLKNIKELETNKLFSDDIFDEFFRRLNPPEHVYAQGVKVNLDKDQMRLSLSRAGELIKIKGVAGCGKTTILAHRAVDAFRRHSSPVLILTFNITLTHYIKDKISDIRENIGFNNFEITNYHEFFNAMLNECGIDANEFRDSRRKANLSKEQILDLLYRHDHFKGQEVRKYQTILIDEIQDYEPDWVKIIKNTFLDSDGEMILFGEFSQNIYERDLSKRESVVVQGFGTWKKLTTSHRPDIASPLIKLFKEFQEEFLIKKYPDSEIFDSAYTSDVASSREIPSYPGLLFTKGELFDSTDKKPGLPFPSNDDYLQYQSYLAEDDCKKLYVEIVDCITVKNLVPNDIVILCSSIVLLRNLNSFFSMKEKTISMVEDIGEFYKITRCDEKTPIKKIKEREVEHGEALRTIRRRKKSFFMLNSGLLKFSTIHSFKGLEAPTVFCILLEKDSPEIIYTAMTRAKKNLIIFDVINSRYSSFFNKLRYLEHRGQII